MKAQESERRRHLTLLTGAGASLYACAPSTSDLTAAVARGEAGGEILHALQGIHSGANFEDVLHVLEELELFADPGLRSRPARSLKPFLAPGNVLATYDWLALRRARFDVLQAIRDEISCIQYEDSQPLYDWLRPFVDDCDVYWFTLNYDVLADIVIDRLSRDAEKPWYDGFGPPLGQFRPDQYARAEDRFGPIHLWLAHLHGSVRFAYRDGDKRMAHGPPFEIVLAPSVEKAADNWRCYHARALAEEPIELGAISPIISGLRKSDKLDARPYSNYLHKFAQALSGSPDLLIIGYGGSDPHITSWLRQFIDIHLARARVIEVTSEKDPQRSAIGQLARYDLNWKELAPGVYRCGMGVDALVITTGIAHDKAAPIDLMRDHFSGGRGKC